MKQSISLILLSTYNGEQFLSAQLESILSQTDSRWILLMRDDGSTDNTLKMLKQYAEQDARIFLIEDNLGNLNIQKSFSQLMQHALNRTEPYIFFCDQDDVWLPNKLSRQVSLLQILESRYGKGIPLLIHSDLHVVDEHLKTIHPSFIQFERLSYNLNQPLKTLLINNYVTGCTVGINQALLKLATPVAENALMHDWWCALCAGALGHIAFINEPTVLYRQHSKNSIGSSGFYGKLKELKQIKKSFTKRKNNLKKCFLQASNLLLRIEKDNKNYSSIQKFNNLLTQNFFLRYLQALFLQLKPLGNIRTAAFWFFLLFAGEDY